MEMGHDTPERIKIFIRDFLTQAGLPDFELGEDSYPVPGPMIKYFREHMVYVDSTTGKQKHWTQADLAGRLDLTEIMVYNMEKHSQALDSIERRRILATILKIPPVLLGLADLDMTALANDRTRTPEQRERKRSKVGKETVEQYQNILEVYGAMYAQGSTYAVVNDIDTWAQRLEQDIYHARPEDKNALLHVLWDYEILCSSIHGSDLQEWNKTSEHIDNALEIAAELDDKDLQAASFYLKSVHSLRQGKPGLAKTSLEGALMYADGALPQTKGAIYQQHARLYTKENGPLGITLVQKMCDEAEKYAGVQSDITTIKFSKGVYLLNRASLLVNLKRPTKALELIDHAERYLIPKRYLVLLDILRAECCMIQKKPEYEQAVSLLEGAIADSKEIRVERNRDQIEKLYRKLLASTYGNAPEVVDLGLALRDLRAKKR